MVLGMQDPIKTQRRQKGCTLYGVPIDTFLAATGISLEELGWSHNDDTEQNNDTLWTAKIHPMVPIEEETVVRKRIQGGCCPYTARH
jgi:hypothetical protein